MRLQKGQRLRLNDLTDSQKVVIRAGVRIGSGDADVTCFGVDEGGRLSDERYFIFYNQPRSPEGAVSMTASGGETVFNIDLGLLPVTVQKLVVTVASEGALMRDITEGVISLSGGDENVAEYHFSGADFGEERALILCEIYRKANVWRYSVVASGFNGGLDALLTHFGGEVAKSQSPAPRPIPSPASGYGPPHTSGHASSPELKVNLNKISLKKSGDTHKIDLKKSGGEIHANLNWNAGKKRLFGGGAIDLDLACMYRLKTGEQGVIQALGNSFGSATDPPYILLDRDDRSGSVTGGENMYFKRPELLDFAVVFAYIYEGVANWRSTDAKVVLHQQGAPDIEIHIDNPNSKERFCVLASLEGKNGALNVKREDKFFAGHREVDKYYGFGFKWVTKRK